MKYSSELLDIVKNKGFKTFWHCLDYLLLAGYSPLDAFGVTVKEFGNDKILSDVAFIRYTDNTKTNNKVLDLATTHINASGDAIMGFDPYTARERDTTFRSEIVVGIIDETNIHLEGIYSVYRKWWVESKLSAPVKDIESTCEILTIRNLNLFIIEFLRGCSETKFGYNLFVEISKNWKPNSSPDGTIRPLYINEEGVRRLRDEFGSR